MSILKLQIIGYIGQDAAINDVVSDSKAINFSVAHSEKWEDANGVKNERTTWVNCSYFRKPDKIGLAQYLKKGTLVYVEGSPSARAFTKSDGTNAASLDLRVHTIKLLSSGDKEELPF